MGNPYAPDASKKPQTPTVAEPPAPTVPPGSVTEVENWIGSDKTRAQLAIESERSREHPRKGVLSAARAVLKRS